MVDALKNNTHHVMQWAARPTILASQGYSLTEEGECEMQGLEFFIAAGVVLVKLALQAHSFQVQRCLSEGTASLPSLAVVYTAAC